MTHSLFTWLASALKAIKASAQNAANFCTFGYFFGRDVSVNTDPKDLSGTDEVVTNVAAGIKTASTPLSFQDGSIIEIEEGTFKIISVSNSGQPKHQRIFRELYHDINRFLLCEEGYLCILKRITS